MSLTKDEADELKRLIDADEMEIADQSIGIYDDRAMIALEAYIDSLTQPAPELTDEEWIELAIRDVAELPDRDSPADWPEAMLVTADELRNILTDRAKRSKQ